MLRNAAKKTGMPIFPPRRSLFPAVSYCNYKPISLLPIKSYQILKQTAHLHLTLKIRMSGALALHPRVSKFTARCLIKHSDTVTCTGAAGVTWSVWRLGYGLDGQGLECRQGREIVLFSKMCRLVVRPAHSPI